MAARKGLVRRYSLLYVLWSSEPWMGLEQFPVWEHLIQEAWLWEQYCRPLEGGWSSSITAQFLFFQDPYNMLAPKPASGTKEDPNLVPSITNKRIVGCICKYLITIFSFNIPYGIGCLVLRVLAFQASLCLNRSSWVIENAT